MRKFHALPYLATAAAVGTLFVGAVSAVADVNSAPSTTGIVHRLDADELQARALESKIAIARQKTGLVRTAALFGESDEEKAARIQHEQAQDASIAQLNQRVGDLEDSLRRLTGQMEQLDHKLNEINSNIDRMQKSFDYKICTMTAQQLGTTADQLPCGGGTGASAPPSGAQQQGYSGQPFNPPPSNAANAPVHLSPPSGVLGTIPSNTAMPIPPPAPVDNGAAPDGASANRPQFDAAMKLLAKANYDQARSAFRTYADNNPNDPMTPQAVYWVGDISYLQKDYPNAARAFAEEIKKHGDSPRAPESMLKLGQSLIAMDQKQEGCTTLGALHSKYPQASQNVIAQAKVARKAAGCR